MVSKKKTTDINLVKPELEKKKYAYLDGSVHEFTESEFRNMPFNSKYRRLE